MANVEILELAALAAVTGGQTAEAKPNGPVNLQLVPTFHGFWMFPPTVYDVRSAGPKIKCTHVGGEDYVCKIPAAAIEGAEKPRVY